MDIQSNEVAFSVTIASEELVQATQPPPQARLLMSHLDNLMWRIPVGIFFCYKKIATTPTLGGAVATLKRSLSEVLVPYYVFAGEVAENPTGVSEVICSNRGVEFSVARANVELRELDLHEPERMLGKGLMPVLKTGIFAVQVTELKCGGIVVSCMFDHHVVDAYSTNMFLASWAEISSAKPLSTIPSFNRSRLQPRKPPIREPYIYDRFIPLSSVMIIKQEMSSINRTRRIFYVKSSDISHLQQVANDNKLAKNDERRTKLESFTSYFWKKISRCTKAKACSALISIDGRSRFGIDTTGSTPPMSSYFGNMVDGPYSTLSVEELKVKDLSQVAEVAHGIIKSGATEEHFLGLVDCLADHLPDRAIHKDITTKSEAFVMSSGLRFPLSKVDFGWGRPTLASYYIPDFPVTYVMPLMSPLENGDWLVCMLIDQNLLKEIKEDLSNFFHPLTTTYLGL